MNISHSKLEHMAQEYLISLGYTTNIEHKIEIGNKIYIVDIYGERYKNGRQKEKETIVIECGNVDGKKLSVLSEQFDKVIVWGHNVEFQGSNLTKKLQQLTTKLTKCKNVLKECNKRNNILQEKLYQKNYIEERRKAIYGTIIAVGLHEIMGGKYSFSIKNLENIMPKLVESFDLAFKIVHLKDTGFEQIPKKDRTELINLQKKIEELLPKIEKRPSIEEWY